MIARLRGAVLEADLNRLVVDVNGVGYEVWVPQTVVTQSGIIGEPIDLVIKTLVREDDLSLFGFESSAQKNLFELLRGVQGCGSKTSLALIGTLGDHGLRNAIMLGDTKTLIKAPGVGAKLAEKIVAALRDRMAEVALTGSAPTKSGAKAVVAVALDDELLEACIGLGYPRQRVEPLLDEARESAETLELQLRHLLKRLAR